MRATYAKQSARWAGVGRSLGPGDGVEEPLPDEVSGSTSGGPSSLVRLVIKPPRDEYPLGVPALRGKLPNGMIKDRVGNRGGEVPGARAIADDGRVVASNGNASGRLGSGRVRSGPRPPSFSDLAPALSGERDENGGDLGPLAVLVGRAPKDGRRARHLTSGGGDGGPVECGLEWRVLGRAEDRVSGPATGNDAFHSLDPFVGAEDSGPVVASGALERVPLCVGQGGAPFTGPGPPAPGAERPNPSFMPAMQTRNDLAGCDVLGCDRPNPSQRQEGGPFGAEARPCGGGHEAFGWPMCRTDRALGLLRVPGPNTERSVVRLLLIIQRGVALLFPLALPPGSGFPRGPDDGAGRGGPIEGPLPCKRAGQEGNLVEESGEEPGGVPGAGDGLEDRSPGGAERAPCPGDGRAPHKKVFTTELTGAAEGAALLSAPGDGWVAQGGTARVSGAEVVGLDMGGGVASG